MPVFYCLGFWAGTGAVAYGSPTLNALLPDVWVDILGVALCISSFAALVGVAFPRLWRLEIFGLISITGLAAGYVATVALSAADGGIRSFVAVMLALSLPMALSRLMILGEELKDRKDEDGA